MPDTSVLYHTCVWCGDRLQPDEISMTKDEETGRVFFEHRDRCP